MRKLFSMCFTVYIGSYKKKSSSSLYYCCCCHHCHSPAGENIQTGEKNKCFDFKRSRIWSKMKFKPLSTWSACNWTYYFIHYLLNRQIHKKNWNSFHCFKTIYRTLLSIHENSFKFSCLLQLINEIWWFLQC